MFDSDSESDSRTLVSTTSDLGKDNDGIVTDIVLSQSDDRAYRGPRLYYDLYEYILSCTYRHTWFVQELLRYILVSKEWHDVTERVLYRNVHVPNGNILLFCETIDARPELARYVRRLSYLRGLREPPKPGDYERLYRLLRKLPQLSEIVEGRSPTYDIIDDGNPETFLLYKDLPCPVEMLHTRQPLPPSVMFDVLRSLPHLHDFSHLDHYEHEAAILPGTLSSCTSLQVGPWFLRSLAPNSPLPQLQHLTFRWTNSDWVREEEFPAEIARVGQTLTSLCLYRSSNDAKDYVPMSSLLRMLAPSTPNLVILTLLDGFSFSPRDNKVIRETITAKFKKLRVYSWFPDFAPQNKLGDGSWDTDEEDGDAVHSDPDDDEPRPVKEERYVAKHFRDIPSLQYFFTNRDHLIIFYKRVEGGRQGEFRRNGWRDQCIADFLWDPPHLINPDRPEDFFCYRVYDHTHLRPRPSF